MIEVLGTYEWRNEKGQWIRYPQAIQDKLQVYRSLTYTAKNNMRYAIDLIAMEQTNLTTKGKRKVRIAPEIDFKLFE